jgi:hypothetical protein
LRTSIDWNQDWFSPQLLGLDHLHDQMEKI